LVCIDASLIMLAELIAYAARFDTMITEDVVLRYGLISTGLLIGWLLMAAAAGAYESRHFGTGPEEYKRVLVGAAGAFGLVAVMSYVFKLEIARGFTTATFALGLILLLMGRNLARRRLVRQRHNGQQSHRALVVGSAASVNDMVGALLEHPEAGIRPVAACTPGPSKNTEWLLVDRVGGIGDVVHATRRVEADIVVITPGPDINADTLRSICWALEGLGIDLAVTPSLHGVA